MPTRDQLTDERVRELITELGEAGIIHEDEAAGMAGTREFGEAREIRETTPEPPAVSRDKVSGDTHDEFRAAYDGDEAIAIVWEVLTGVDVRDRDE